MKKLLFISISIWCVININAQQEFAPIGAVWYFDKVEDWNPPDEGYVKFTSMKDTSINSLSARVIHEMYYTSKGDSVDWGNEYIHQSGDTIFYLVEGEFKLLYDYSLTEGDTMQFYSNQYNPCIDTASGSVLIDSISSLTINNIELKELFSSPTEESAWQYNKIVERFGNISGFYPIYVNSCGIMDDMPVIGDLRCYCDNELGMYKRGSRPCDTLIVHITNLNTIVNDGVIIYPTTSSDCITIKLNNSFNHISIVEVYSLQGQLVLKNKLSSSEFILDIKGLNQGVYSLRIMQEGSKTIVRKIIKE
jgi:hypothetical protein